MINISTHTVIASPTFLRKPWGFLGQSLKMYLLCKYMEVQKEVSYPSSQSLQTLENQGF